MKQRIAITSQELIDRHIDRERLIAFLDYAWEGNQRFNLFSRRLRREDLTILAAESVFPVQFGWIDGQSGPVLDIGSGWGIPAVPLLLCGLNLDMTLIERSQKKADYLLLLLQRLGLAASVVNAELQAFNSPSRFGTIILRRVALDKKMSTQIRRLTEAPATVVNFGPHPAAADVASAELISYALDNLPLRQIARVQIL